MFAKHWQLVCIAAFVTGIACGSAAGIYAATHRATEDASSAHLLGAVEALDRAHNAQRQLLVLEVLQSSDYKTATDMLESWLDRDIVTLAHGLASGKVESRAVRQVIELVQAYRRKYRHNSADPTVDQAIAEALATRVR